MTDNPNQEDCGNICNADAQCIAFDYTTTSKSDSCRLYDINEITYISDDNRNYCTDTRNFFSFIFCTVSI